jgi:hypothetical protein
MPLRDECHKPSKKGMDMMPQVTKHHPPCERGECKIFGCCERVTHCHRYDMSQWTKRPVDILFGSKCSVDVPLVDTPSRHPVLRFKF